MHSLKNAHAGRHICFGIIGCRANEIPAGIWQANTNLKGLFGEVEQKIVGSLLTK